MKNLMRKAYARFETLKSQKGATMIEYALLAGLISVVAIIAITAAGTNVNAIFDYVQTQLGGAVPAT